MISWKEKSIQGRKKWKEESFALVLGGGSIDEYSHRGREVFWKGRWRLCSECHLGDFVLEKFTHSTSVRGVGSPEGNWWEGNEPGIRFLR